MTEAIDTSKLGAMHVLTRDEALAQRIDKLSAEHFADFDLSFMRRYDKGFAEGRVVSPLPTEWHQSTMAPSTGVPVLAEFYPGNDWSSPVQYQVVCWDGTAWRPYPLYSPVAGENGYSTAYVNRWGYIPNSEA